jgi:uncharacterized protein
MKPGPASTDCRRGWRDRRRALAGRLTSVLVRALLAGLCLAGPARAAPSDCPPPPAAETTLAPAPGTQDRGLLWRLRKGGVTSYLYGSIHVGRPDWLAPGPQVRAALRASDTLALEIDLGDPGMQQRLQAALAGRSAAGAGAARELPPALQARLARQIEAACLSAGQLAPLHPVMQAVMLMLWSARRDGLDPAHAQEHALGLYARAAGMPVVSLETPESQIELLLPDDAAQAGQLLAQTLDQLESGESRSVLQRLARDWAQGRLDDLANYERWCRCADSDEDRALLRRANDERNPALAAAIDALHGQGRRVFAAVGSLHMIGPQALPRLLTQRGYKVERVALVRPAPK